MKRQAIQVAIVVVLSTAGLIAQDVAIGTWKGHMISPANQLERIVTGEIRERIVQIGRELGFAYVTLDLGGYRRGAMNEILAPGECAPDKEHVRRAVRRKWG